MKIGIIGFGRFGRVLYEILSKDFNMVLYNRNSKLSKIKFKAKTKVFTDLSKVYAESEVVFFAVPISKFEKVIKEHRQYFKNHLLIDVLSVKVHPKNILKKYLYGTSSW